MGLCSDYPYILNEDDFKDLWRKCVFVFDTNVLLGLYEYSVHTREELISILEQIKEQLWLPHQIASEFDTKRKTIIKNQYDNYKSLKDSLEEVFNSIVKKNNESEYQHPFLTSIDSIKEFIDNAKELIRKDEERELGFSVDDDPIKDQIENIYIKGKWELDIRSSNSPRFML